MTGPLQRPLGFAVAGSMLEAGIAGASVGDPICAHGTNYGSTACYYGVLQYGDYSSWNNSHQNLSSGDLAAGHHMNQTVWSYSGSPCNAWMEIGYTHGYHGNAGYFYYGAYSETNGYYHDFSLGNASPDGSHHTYSVEYVGGTSYQELLDGNVVDTLSGGLGAGSCQGQTGLETSILDSSTSSDTFAHTPLKWKDTSGNWHSNWNTSQYWIDQPCGSGPCLNGQWVSANQYNENAVG